MNAERALRKDEFITDAAALADLRAAVAASSIVAIDTEFIRERTYYPMPCLIQIATDDWAACVDCIGPLDLRPLLATLLAPERSWVLHSARQDLEIIWNLTQALPARVIDTQIAAALLGFPPQLGLQSMLTELLGVNLEKGHTRTDWSRRPLPEAALSYAFDDVRFLLQAWRELEGRLADLGRLAWLEEDCRRLAADPPVPELATIFRRLKPVTALSLRAQCAVLALLEWREHRARDADRPRRWILTDEHLLKIGRALPVSLAKLAAITELPRGVVTRSGAEILAVIGRSDSPELCAAVESMLADRKPDKERAQALQEIVLERARTLGIQPEVLATRRDLSAIAAGAEPGTVLSAWRMQALEINSPAGSVNSGREPS
jgi:ribonuclease D